MPRFEVLIEYDVILTDTVLIEVEAEDEMAALSAAQDVAERDAAFYAESTIDAYNGRGVDADFEINYDATDDIYCLDDED